MVASLSCASHGRRVGFRIAAACRASVPARVGADAGRARAHPWSAQLRFGRRHCPGRARARLGDVAVRTRPGEPRGMAHGHRAQRCDRRSPSRTVGTQVRARPQLPARQRVDARVDGGWPLSRRGDSRRSAAHDVRVLPSAPRTGGAGRPHAQGTLRVRHARDRACLPHRERDDTKADRTGKTGSLRRGGSLRDPFRWATD